MAGIGFELRKLFEKKGVIRTAKAYTYAAVICAGPMLLGFLMLLGITSLCVFAKTPVYSRDLLVSIITYTLLASVTVSSFFSMTVTRYVSDMLFEGNLNAVLPAFWGSNVIMLPVGVLLYGTFLIFSGATFAQGCLSLVLFSVLIVVWNAMSFLSAIKDYKSIFLSFLTAVLTAFLSGYIMLALSFPPVEALILAVSLGYGVMLIWDVVLLHRYFPLSSTGAFTFMKWLDEFLPLALSGFFMNIGMFAHIVIIWSSEIGVRIKGLFYGAPYYDVPSLIAFMTALITTVNFVVTVEVNFYPKYRNHYSLYNDKGIISDIKQSEKEMIKTLRQELFYTALKQLLFSAVCIAVGGYLLDLLPLGFNEVMKGYFRTLTVGYGIWAIGNMVMLILLYFTDYKGAMTSNLVFAVTSILFTVLSLFFPSVYYGFGFLLSSMLFTLIATLRLDYFTKKLPYYILASQPLVAVDRSGVFSRAGAFLEKNLEDK